MRLDDAALLFAETSSLRGMGRVLDLRATRNVYNDSPTPDIADVRAMRSDWTVVIKDLKCAIDRFGKVENDQKKGRFTGVLSPSDHESMANEFNLSGEHNMRAETEEISPPESSPPMSLPHRSLVSLYFRTDLWNR